MRVPLAQYAALKAVKVKWDIGGRKRGTEDPAPRNYLSGVKKSHIRRGGANRLYNA